MKIQQREHNRLLMRNIVKFSVCLSLIELCLKYLHFFSVTKIVLFCNTYFHWQALLRLQRLVREALIDMAR